MEEESNSLLRTVEHIEYVFPSSQGAKHCAWTKMRSCASPVQNGDFAKILAVLNVDQRTLILRDGCSFDLFFYCSQPMLNWNALDDECLAFLYGSRRYQGLKMALY